MHLHIYSEQYSSGDFKLKDIILTSPKNSVEHLKAVVEQINKYNIALTYAIGDFKALDSINKNYPDKFLPSARILSTSELLNDKNYIETLKLKIKNGEVLGIGEVGNFYTGIAPNDPVLDTLYRIAEENDLPIGIHFGLAFPSSQLTTYPNMRVEYANPLMLQDVLIKFPKLRLYIMHAGLPFFPEETFAMLFMFLNLYADISALPWGGLASGYLKESLKEFLIKADKNGFIGRLMFGSDEHIRPGAIGLSIDFINQADYLTETQKRYILYNNAARFLKLSDAEIKKHFSK